MATSSPAARSPMRQQLDELDALLQRMLDLPTDPGELHAAPPMASAFTAPAAPILQDGRKQPVMRLLPDPGPVAPPPTSEPQSWDPAFTFNLNPQNGSSILGSRSPAAAVNRPEPAPVPSQVWRSETVGYTAPAADDVPANAPAVIPEPTFRALQFERKYPASPLAAPLFAFDQMFDAIVGLLPFGPALTGPSAKNALGVLGIAMTIGGIVWGVLDYGGWTR